MAVAARHLMAAARRLAHTTRWRKYSTVCSVAPTVRPSALCHTAAHWSIRAAAACFLCRAQLAQGHRPPAWQQLVRLRLTSQPVVQYNIDYSSHFPCD